MAYTYRLSSGLFGLPAGAKSVDWSALNDTAQVQDLRVTVFACPVGAPKKRLAPGPVEVKLQPKTTTHNANSVGHGEIFEPGMPTEIIVQINDLGVLPTVEVWLDMGATVIAGTRIGPRDFVRL